MKKLFVSVLFVMTFIGCSSDDDSKVTEEPKTSVAEDAAAKAKAEAAAKAEAEAKAKAKAEAEAEAVKEETKQLVGNWDLIDSDSCKSNSSIHIDKENSTIAFHTYEVNSENVCTPSGGRALTYTLEGRKMIVKWVGGKGNSYYTFNIKDDVLTMVQEDNTGGHLNVTTLKYRKSID